MRRRRSIPTLAFALAGTVLAVTGCAGSKPLAIEKTSSEHRVGPTSRNELTGDELDLLDRLQEQRDAGLVFSDVEAMCIVRGLTDELDADTADTAVDGLTTEDVRSLTGDEARAVADITVGCTDFKATLTEFYSWVYTAEEENVRCAVDPMSTDDEHAVAAIIIAQGAEDTDAEQDRYKRFIVHLGTCVGEEVTVNALTFRFQGDGANTEEQAACVARKVVAKVGPGQGLRYTTGVDYSGEDARSAVDAFWECRDMRENFRESLTKRGTPAAVAACIAEKLDEADLRNLQIATLSGNNDSALAKEALSNLTAVQRLCER